jgi:hypothetical protein
VVDWSRDDNTDQSDSVCIDRGKHFPLAFLKQREIVSHTKPRQNRAYFFFAALNLFWIPVIFLFYPETKGRSLESIECMFDTSPFFWQMEKAFRYNEERIAQESEILDDKVHRKSSDHMYHEVSGGEA